MARTYRVLMGVLRALISVALILGVVNVACLKVSMASVVADQSSRQVVVAADLSMDQAVKMAEQRFKARVVRAETQHDGARTIYILKLLNDAGHVWTVRVDATNGAIL